MRQKDWQQLELDGARAVPLCEQKNWGGLVDLFFASMNRIGYMPIMSPNDAYISIWAFAVGIPPKDLRSFCDAIAHRMEEDASGTG